MELVPKAKPVRIRIKSGGEEHFNLESLRQNFSVHDLWEAVTGKSLSKWLRTQFEDNLADAVDGFCDIKEPSTDDYIQFSKLFFANEAIVDAESLLKFYQNKGLTNSFNNALLELFDIMSFADAKKSFELYKSLKENDEWIALFEHKIADLEDTKEEIECHNILSTLYSKQRNDTKMNYHQNKSDKLKELLEKNR